MLVHPCLAVEYCSINYQNIFQFSLSKGLRKLGTNLLGNGPCFGKSVQWSLLTYFILLPGGGIAHSRGTGAECHLIELRGQPYLYPRLFLEVFHSQWTRPKSACLAGLLPKLLWL